MEKRVERVVRETRTDVTRETAERKKVWVPPAMLPDYSEKLPGFHLRWVRRELRGVEEDPNILKYIRQGYEIVKPEEVGAVNVSTMETGKFSGAIISGDLILMKVPEEFYEQRKAFYKGQADKMQKAVDREFDGEGSHLMPVSRSVQNSVTTGQRPKTEPND